MNASDTKQKPKSGVAILLIATTIGGIALASLFVGFYRFKRKMDIDNCAENLHQIGLGILLYENAHNHRYPDSLSQLLQEEGMAPPTFVCPTTGDDYIYLGKGLTEATATEKTVVALDSASNHSGGMNVLFGDGHAEFIVGNGAQYIAGELRAKRVPIVLPDRR